MSWELDVSGTPGEILALLEEHSTKLAGLHRAEFDAALPHLRGLLSQNYDTREGADVVLRLVGSGYGTQSPDPETGNPLDVERRCEITLEHVSHSGHSEIKSEDIITPTPEPAASTAEEEDPESDKEKKKKHHHHK